MDRKHGCVLYVMCMSELHISDVSTSKQKTLTSGNLYSQWMWPYKTLDFCCVA